MELLRHLTLEMLVIRVHNLQLVQMLHTELVQVLL